MTKQTNKKQNQKTKAAEKEPVQAYGGLAPLNFHRPLERKNKEGPFQKKNGLLQSVPHHSHLKRF